MISNSLMDFTVLLGMAVIAYTVRALDIRGIAAAFVVGFLVLELGGVYPFAALFMFVFLGVMATKYRFGEKIRLGLAEEHRGMRSWGNVLGNGLAAVIFVALEHYFRLDVLWAAVFASIATANADTLASELGKVMGKSPRMITNFKKARPGMNGAVSLQGEVVSVLGALAIALFAVFVSPHRWQMVFAVTLGGFFGANIDSLVGATLENRGITNNDSTNFLATFFGGVLGALLFYVMV